MSWISVKKQKPSDGPVLIWSLFYANGNAAVAFYAGENWYLFHCGTVNEPISEPDYWMPLPAPPKKEGGEVSRFNKLYNHLAEEHNLLLLESEKQEILNLILNP